MLIFISGISHFRFLRQTFSAVIPKDILNHVFGYLSVFFILRWERLTWFCTFSAFCLILLCFLLTDIYSDAIITSNLNNSKVKKGNDA